MLRFSRLFFICLFIMIISACSHESTERANAYENVTGLPENKNTVDERLSQGSSQNVVASGSGKFDHDWTQGTLEINAVVKAPTDGIYNYYKSFYRYADGDSSSYSEFDMETPRFAQVFDSLKTKLARTPHVSFYSISMFFSSPLKKGPHDIQANLYFHLETHKPLLAVNDR